MRVNITGHGIIPGLGTIPPVYNEEMSEKSILRLLNFPSFKLYEATTHTLITKKNIDSFIKQSMNTNISTALGGTTDVVDAVDISKVIAANTYDEHDVSGLITDDPIRVTPPQTISSTDTDSKKADVNVVNVSSATASDNEVNNAVDNIVDESCNNDTQTTTGEIVVENEESSEDDKTNVKVEHGLKNNNHQKHNKKNNYNNKKH